METNKKFKNDSQINKSRESTISNIEGNTKDSKGFEVQKINIKDLRKLGWLKSLDELEFLYILLIQFSCIVCNFKEFESHFLGESISKEKILWTETIERLTLLIYFLTFNGYLPQNSQPHNLVKNHFIFYNCENLKGNSVLRNALRNAMSKDNKNSDNIELIVYELVKFSDKLKK